jgi:hypothetical protein
MNSLKKYHDLSGFLRNYHEQSPEFHLFIRSYEVARTSGAGPCAPFIYSYVALKMLERMEQVHVLHLFIHTAL